jgi:hypothetical protein
MRRHRASFCSLLACLPGYVIAADTGDIAIPRELSVEDDHLAGRVGVQGSTLTALSSAFETHALRIAGIIAVVYDYLPTAS